MGCHGVRSVMSSEVVVFGGDVVEWSDPSQPKAVGTCVRSYFFLL